MAFDHKEYKRQWYLKNRERKKEQDRRRYEAKREEILAYHKERRDKNPEYMKEYWRNNRDKQRAYAAKGREKHGDKYREITRKWKKANPDRVLASCNKRRAMEIFAIPRCLVGNFFEERKIAAFYAEARRLAEVRGGEWHVDHIVPLRGKNVCGLHVSWNLQVLPKTENLKKGNRMS